MEDLRTDGPICTDCAHRAVCAMYDSIMDAVIDIESFYETNPYLDDQLLVVLAGSCRQFMSVI